MTGEEVKNLLQKRGYTLKYVAEKMGTTPQNFQSMLNVADIKTGVLERISSAIDKDIFFFYEIDKDFQGYNKTEISESEYLNALFKAESYEQQLRQQQETISAQKKLIEALEERVKDINVIVQLKENEIYNLKKVTALPEESAECADVG